MVQAEIVSTGIPGLDHIVNGGLPARRFYLLQGDPGAGKTTVGIQFLLEGVRQGESVLYVSLSETREELESIAKSHGWDISGIPVFELASGVEYLNAIYLMVAAVNPTATDPTSVRRCSFGREWRPPTLNPEDKIYRAYDGIINGARFVNDDGDHDDDPSIGSVARIDEDFLDGRDNDGDGKIDEDHGAIGQQEFSFVMRDDTREAINTVAAERHVPLGLEAKCRAWAYSIAGFQDFNVCEYNITNVSGHELDSLMIGWTVDCDAGPTQIGGYWTDDIDMPQYPQGEYVFRVGSQPGDLPDPAMAQGGPGPVTKHDRSLDSKVPRDSALCPTFPIRINAFSTCDQDGDNGRTPGVATFMIIDHTIDPTGVNAPKRVGVLAFRSTTQGTTYQQGGLPRLDQERFESMSGKDPNLGTQVNPPTEDNKTLGTDGFISQVSTGLKGDYAQQVSIGPFLHVAPGQTINATIAFGVRLGSVQLANGFQTDYQRYRNHVLGGADLMARYPSLQNAITAQIAFQGIHETRDGYKYELPDFHGRETRIRLPRGTPQQTITEDCSDVPGRDRRDVIVNDRDYSWFDFDCNYCTGVWDADKRVGLFHKTWNAAAPPPNPNTNVSAQYNFTANPNRDVVAPGDRSVRLAWDNLPEVTSDPKSRWRDLRGFTLWKVADWQRPVGAGGPSESDWRLIGDFTIFDYYTDNIPGSEPIERNYTRNPDGSKNCDSLFIPNIYDPATGRNGKVVPICLDRYDIWNRQNGQILKPNWTIPCTSDDPSLEPKTPEINTGDIEFQGGSASHVFNTAGTFDYLCLRHPDQKGTVIVQAPVQGMPNAPDSAVVQIIDASSSGFLPSSVTIRTGGHVRWANASDQNHAIQSDRHCQINDAVIVHRVDKDNLANHERRVVFPVGRYEYDDPDVKNGFVYFYSVTAFDSTTDNSITTELGGRRSAVEADGVVPEAQVDAHGKNGVWVVPNPYRGNAQIQDRPSSWDLIPNATDPTGTHLDFMGLPSGKWTIRIYTVSGDLVQELHSTDAVNESIRQPVNVQGTSYPGYNRQQDNPNDGQARWNLISRNGQDVVSGIYLFTVDSSEGTQRGKFVIIR